MSDAALIELPGVRLSYLDSGGEGEAIVFLHAHTGVAESWRPQIDHFAPLGYRCIAFDRRGWGASLPVPATGPQPGSIAEDLEQLVCHLGIERFHLVAIAGGTFAALDYSAWRPERVRSLVACASTGMITDPEIAGFIDRIAVPCLLAPAPAEFRELSAGFRGADPERAASWIATARAARQPGAPDNYVRTPNTFEKIASISAPVLAIAGGADLIAPPEMMRRWVAHLADARFEVVSEAGHAVSYEQPERFNALVEAFLDEVRALTR
jgi:pimeloyl-ACP methyl ester carboxylesterase